MKSSGLRRPWAAENKKDPLEKAFLGTMKTINERCQSLDKKNTEEEIKKNDEETLFCYTVAFSSFHEKTPHGSTGSIRFAERIGSLQNRRSCAQNTSRAPVLCRILWCWN